MVYIIRSNQDKDLYLFAEWLKIKKVKFFQKLSHQLIINQEIEDEVLDKIKFENYDLTVVDIKLQRIDFTVIDQLMQLANSESSRLCDIADVIEDNDYMLAKKLRYQAHQLDAVVALLSFSFSEYL